MDTRTRLFTAVATMAVVTEGLANALYVRAQPAATKISAYGFVLFSLSWLEAVASLQQQRHLALNPAARGCFVAGKGSALIDIVNIIEVPINTFAC